MYTVDYFLDKFSKIEESLWTTGVFEHFDGRRCAMGHCLSDVALKITAQHMERTGIRGYKPTAEECKTIFAESLALCQIFNAENPGDGSLTVYKINNGDDPRYQQPTPKQRILAALYDIKKLQAPEVKEKIVYVAVPVTITEQAKELVMS